MTDKILKYKNKLEKLAKKRGFPTCKPTYSFNGKLHYFSISLPDPRGGSTDIATRSAECMNEAYKKAKDYILKHRTAIDMQVMHMNLGIEEAVAEAKKLGISEKKFAKMITKEWVNNGDEVIKIRSAIPAK